MSFFIINSSSADVCREPDFNSGVVTQALLGESCEILDQNEDWSFIQKWDNYKGWVHNFFGVKSETPYKYTHYSFNLSSPLYNESRSEIVRYIYFNSLLKIDSDKNGYKVILPDGIIGWTDDRFHTKHPTPTRDNILKTAERFLGTPYRWGGKTPSGMDCSGLVQTVFKSAGVNLPRDAHQQKEFLKNAQVDLEESETGDLLFFSENGSVTHVAICTGKMGFINARGWVRKESLDENAYNFNKKLKSLFCSAVNVLNLLTA